MIFRKLILELFRRFRNLILYGIIGTFTSTLDFMIFSILSQNLGLYYIIANCISVFIGITCSFLLNRAYNFKIKDKTKQRFLIFLSIGLCGLCLSNIIMWIGIDYLQLNNIITKLTSIILVVGFQFLLNKFITFRN